MIKDALDKAHFEWLQSRFDDTEKTHEETVLDTLAGFLDLPIIQPKESKWGDISDDQDGYETDAAGTFKG